MEKKKQSRGVLADYFPIIRTKAEIRETIDGNPGLSEVFQQWSKQEQEEFLDLCSGERGLKAVYDGVFKEVFNPESTPERLEALLSLILGHEVKIEEVLPNDSTRLGAESSLLYTDIVIQQTDGSLSNVEIQKIGYAFPGARCACYSADLLLRQYKRVRGESNRRVDYRKIKNVYTIVFFEHSPKEFEDFPEDYLHVFRQQSDTGLKMELLQEFYFLPLDIYRENMDNKPIRNELEAWLAFLSFDDPERILELITAYPKFKAMYQDIYEICLNMEKVMSLFSKELRELDHNTVLYMIDEMQLELDQKKEELEEIKGELDQKKEELDQKKEELDQKKEELDQKKEELNQKEEKLTQKEAELNQKEEELAQVKGMLSEKDRLIQQLKAQLAAPQSGKPEKG